VTDAFSHIGASRPELAAFHDALRAAAFGTTSALHRDCTDEEAEGDGVLCDFGVPTGIAEFFSFEDEV
jgi:hypothetical protein